MSTQLRIDPETLMMVIAPVFTCSIAPGRHTAQGRAGEHMFEILGRWTSINFPVRAVVWVQQTSMTTWMAMLDDNTTIEFTVII